MIAPEPQGVAAVTMALVATPSAKGDYVLVCKLDASGTDPDNPIVCMAGYVAMLSAWMDFEQVARPIFNRYGVTVLHAKEFYDTKGEFAGWSRDKKHAFIREIQNQCILGRLDAGVVFGAPKLNGSRPNVPTILRIASPPSDFASALLSTCF